MTLALSPGCGARFDSVEAVDQYLACLSATGFGAVSLGLDQIKPFTVNGATGLQLLRRMLEHHGLDCSDILTVSVRGQERDEAESTKFITDVAHGVGARSILLVCFTKPTDAVMQRLDRLAAITVQAQVKLALEFAPGLAIDSIQKGLEVCATIGSDRMGLVVDTWHFFRGPSTWADLETVPLENVLLVQFDDAPPAISADVMDETTNRRTWPGQGSFELQRFATTLSDRGWAGVSSVEVLSDETRLLDMHTFVRTAYESSKPYWP
ncbi:sugar phosphate isomerase/epimerase family protein [Jatrophihabitans sp. DSM 45814]